MSFLASIFQIWVGKIGFPENLKLTRPFVEVGFDGAGDPGEVHHGRERGQDPLRVPR